MKNNVLVIIVTMMIVFGAQSVWAAQPVARQEVRKEMLEQRAEAMSENKNNNPLMSRIQSRVALVKVTVVSKSTNAFVAQGSDDKEYTVAVDGNVQWRRKFWGKSDFSELNVNDVINVYGRWTNEEMTQIEAKLIRNISVQKRQGVFFGTISSVQSAGFVMTTINRGDQTVSTTGSRLVDRTGRPVSLSSMIVGHRVRIKGLWDTKNSTLTEVTEVKDFDLPPKATVTPKP